MIGWNQISSTDNSLGQPFIVYVVIPNSLFGVLANAIHCRLETDCSARKLVTYY